MRFWEIINRFILWLVLFVLPWQTRYMVNAVYSKDSFVEYASIAVYATDILIILLLLTAIPIVLRKNRFNFGSKFILWPLILLLLWIWASIIWAFGIGLDYLVSVNFASHFTLFVAFYLYLINFVKDIKHIVWPVILGLVVQSGIAIYQYYLNHSIGLKIIGESVLDPLKSGIPVVIVDGVRKLRAHGLLPHANILGGILAVWLIVLSSWFYALKRTKKHYLIWIIFIVLTIALMFSFSRGAWLVLVLGILFMTIMVWFKSIKKLKKAILPGCLVLLVIVSVAFNQRQVILSRFNLEQPVESISIKSRQQQFDSFKTVFVKYPILGVGAGQYVPYLYKINQETEGWTYRSDYSGWLYNSTGQTGNYEPVHNIFLLVLSELGVIGLLIFLSLFIGVFIEISRHKKKLFILSRSLAVAWIAIFVLGLFDHYIWTLQQGKLLMFTILALIAIVVLKSSYNKKVNKG